MTIVVIAAVAMWRLATDPVRRLVTVVGERRVIEARLSGGYSWAALPRKAIRLPRPNASPRVRAANLTLASVPLAPVAENDRATAMLTLLGGDFGASVSRFEQLCAEHHDDARSWSDLAAARYEAGVATSDAALIAGALAAADTALELDEALPEALFNRALAIEHLGVREEARKAWTRFLAVDGASEWSAEARQRMRRSSPIPFFMVDLRANYDRLAADPEFAHQMARERPEETRLYSETVILHDWAMAAAAGDDIAAQRHLTVAREFGRELARNRGDHMVQEAVRAIENADRARRQHLIRGHQLFREGQNESKRDRSAIAKGIFERAALELAQGGSPVHWIAEFYLADMVNSLGNGAGARARELELFAQAPSGFRAYRAHLLWCIGNGYQSDGEFGKALESLERSVATFDDLGEADYAAAVRELTAEVHDRNGNPEEAWKQRLMSLRGVGRLIQPRLATALANAGRGAMMRKEWPVALSLLRLAEDMAVTVDRPTIEAQVHLLQARAFAELHDLEAAHAAISLARAAATKIDDAAAQQEALVDIDRSEAMVASSPQVAVALLTRAIRFHATRGRRVVLPELYLARGRAYRHVAQVTLAVSDFETGIAEVEKHRDSLPEGELRWGTFDTAAELFEEAVSAAIGRGDVSTAFAYAERSRARELLERLRASRPAAEPASFAAGATVIEYFPLPDRLLIFTVTGGVVDVAEERVERTVLEGEAEAFRRALADGATQHRQLGAALYGRLIAPIARHVRPDETLVFVGGHRFPTVAFAALPEGDGYLIQRHEVVVAPSARVYAELASRRTAAVAPATALVIANPASGEVVLNGAERESRLVARQYVASQRLVRGDASSDAYRRFAPAATVIHMATHGVQTAHGEGALLLSDGLLDSRTIASIALPRTRAVVLAACDTAQGLTHAEGTISAARGFLAAGVPAVVATLWKIDDEGAARFFSRLHRDLARGTPAASAVRAAQIESIERGESPALWAAIQCIGTDGGSRS
ncbi:MAG TPA: CHAT domain-containing protein [Thermoanaerobaculia bacterium]|nr:CHAT domain-containing protein [Thermoanaerobaculia bacterium]